MNGRGILRLWALVLPMGILLGLTSVPLVFLFRHFADASLAIEWSAFGPTLGFAVGGAAIATITGGALGMLSSVRNFPGRRGLLALSIVPIAAPPAFWWIGATRVTSAWGNANGPGPAAVVAASPCHRSPSCWSSPRSVRCRQTCTRRLGSRFRRRRGSTDTPSSAASTARRRIYPHRHSPAR
jgi:ABC-type Fe3+ transport system, permease component